MGFFTAIAGQDERDEEYVKTLNYCLRNIRKKADDLGVNLNDYYNTSNSNSFQEESILFFLANAAITAHNKEHSMINMVIRDKKALNKILTEFFTNNGIRVMDLESSLWALSGTGVQGAYGIAYVMAYKHDMYKPDKVMTNFIKSIVNEIPYGNKNYDKSEFT